MSERVAVVGTGPAAEVARAALVDAPTSVEVETPALDAFVESCADYALAVVAGVAGSGGFERANRAAVAAELPWLAVEVGGLGGHALADAAATVAGFAPGGGCFDCLSTRVAAGDPDPSSPRVPRHEARFAGAVAGREATRALGGDDGFGGSVVEVPHTRHTFLPVPDCPVCGGGRERYRLERGHRSVPVGTAIDRAERAVDPRVGLVEAVGERESYPAPYYLAQVRGTEGFSDASASSQAAGVDVGWDGAYMKALGEALERYSAGVYRVGSFVEGSDDDVAGAVSPARFVRPDDAPDPDALAWVPATDLHTGADAHLPAELVHFPPAEERLRPTITTGLGLGSSTDEALVAGLTEVVERDATMLAWYSTFEPLGVAVEDDAYAELSKRARSEGLTATALLVTQDVDVPVVAVALHREGEWPRFALGSAASLDPARAARSALAEAVQNWTELRAMGQEDAADTGGAIARYADFPRGVRGLTDPETTVPLDSVGPDDPPTGADAVDALVGRVDDAGLDAYAARLTPRDVEALGFEAVRVLVPAAQPLFVDDAFFGERARRVPRELGFRARLDRPFHPYP